jgi:hypothetical protein
MKGDNRKNQGQVIKMLNELISTNLWTYCSSLCQLNAVWPLKQHMGRKSPAVANSWAAVPSRRLLFCACAAGDIRRSG